MEWIVINELFPDQITRINNSLLPPHFIGDLGSIRRTQDSVRRVLDELGALSAGAQKLGRIITTAEKLRAADGHAVYLLKDAHANSRAGEAVGLLKVGKKHLFIFDEEQTVREVEPLCVLDFYVKDTHQRCGLGKKLYDYMLQDQQTSADRLAVDGPSGNMRSFLAKNYHITRLIKQPNNFAVSPQFFRDLPATTSLRGRTAVEETPQLFYFEDYEIHMVTKGHCFFCRYAPVEAKDEEDLETPTSGSQPGTPNGHSWH